MQSEENQSNSIYLLNNKLKSMKINKNSIIKKYYLNIK